MDQVTIRKFEFKDIPNKIDWINNPLNNQFLHYELPLEYEKTVAWYQRNKENPSRFDAVIEVEDTPVGLIGLLSIDEKNAKAEYYISMGVHEFKGKGVSTRASELLLDYAFKDLKLNKVYLFTEEENFVAQKLFTKVGFEKEGLLIDDIFSRNQYVNRFVYGMTKSRWKLLKD